MPFLLQLLDCAANEEKLVPDLLFDFLGLVLDELQLFVFGVDFLVGMVKISLVLGFQLQGTAFRARFLLIVYLVLDKAFHIGYFGGVHDGYFIVYKQTSIYDALL